jgi:hypothetical protein
MGPRAVVGAVAKKKSFSCPTRESNPGYPARTVITVLTELFGSRQEF